MQSAPPLASWGWRDVLGELRGDLAVLGELRSGDVLG